MKKFIIKLLVILTITSSVAAYIIINNGYKYLISYSNGFFIPGCIILLISILVFFSHKGQYAFFSYPFMKRKKNKDKQPEYTSYEDYTRKQSEKYESTAFLPYLIVGGSFTLIGIIISLCV